MVTMEVSPLPKLLTASGIETCGTLRSKVNVHAPLFDDRSRRGGTIQVGGTKSIRLVLRRLDEIEDLDVVKDLATIDIDTDSEQVVRFVTSGGQTDLITPDNRRRPPFAVNRNLPANVLCFAELYRQLRRRLRVAIRAVELVPMDLIDLLGHGHGWRE